MRDLEKKVTATVLTLLVVSIWMTTLPVNSADSVILSVDPPSIKDPSLGSGSIFRIDITVADVVHLWGYQFNLSYDTNVLTATDFGIYLPFQNIILPWSRINDTIGNIQLAAYTYDGDHEGLTTTATQPVSWIQFSVDNVGTSVLDLHDSVLADASGNAIPHAAVDGSFDNTPQTIYIRADGSIDPPTAPIIRNGDTYTLTDDIHDSIVVERSNIVLDGNCHTIQGAGVDESKGIDLSGMAYVTVENIQVTNFYYGVYLYSSADNIIKNNDMTNNRGDGVKLSYSSRNSVTGNNMTKNLDGIGLVFSENNVLSVNNASNNTSSGIYLWRSNNNIVVSNKVWLNNLGIWLGESSNNILYHNGFIDNNQQFGVDSSGYINVWDDGYPSGGNYWSDDTDVDQYSGPNQDQPGSDGIRDHPYIIDADNHDRYPLVNPWASPRWTFALITDLHIGRGYADYGGNGIGPDDWKMSGQDYYLTERLRNVTRWINDHRIESNIAFVVVLGDISDSGECSELMKARDILDELVIPYIPVIGNHDVFPYTEAEENELDRNDFNFVFERQFEKLAAEPSLNWHKQSSPDPFDLQNYVFNYQGTNFIALDCTSRTPLPGPLKGVGADAVLWDSTLTWLTENLHENQPTIVFCHHPFIVNPIMAFGPLEIVTIDEAIKISHSKVLTQLAGHIHGYYDPGKLFSPNYSFSSKTDALSHLGELIFSPIFFNANGDYRDESFITPANIPVITTEAMMVGSNTNAKNGVIRIVGVTEDSFEKWTPEDAAFPSLNPYIIGATINLHLSGNTVDFQAYAFAKMFDTGHPIQYYLYIDGDLKGRKDSSIVERVFFRNQELTRGTHEVNLTVVGYAPDGNQVVESIKRIAIVGWLSVRLQCPADIAVIDPSGCSIGKQMNEISNATYTEADLDGDGDLEKFIEILAPIDGDYSLALNGTGLGLYNMEAQLANSQEVVNFTATEIPVSSETIHQYMINWTVLSQAEGGVTVSVDSNRDGTLEYNFTSDRELSRVEFVGATTGHDLGITGITSSKSVIGEGYTLPINITVMNYGLYTETFNVTIYANATLIGTQIVTLANASSTVITNNWDTTGFAKGNYTLSVIVNAVLGETYTLDNTFVYGTVAVVTPGDVNTDGILDVLDAAGVSAHWYPGPPIGPIAFDPNFDINGDGVINVVDAGIVSAYWTGPPKGPLAP